MLILSALTLFYSCSDDDIITGGSSSPSVSGYVRDSRGLPFYPAKVWLNYERSINVDINGYFFFDKVTFPYNLMLIKDSVLTYYCSLTNPKPVIYMENDTAQQNINQALVYLSFPMPVGNDLTKLAVLTKETFYASTENYFYDSTATVRIIWKGERNSIAFKIVLLQGSMLEPLHNVNYSRFGIKDTSVQAGETILLKFNSSEIQYDPPENFVFINNGAVFNNVSLRAEIAFDGYNKNSNLLIGENTNPANFIIKVPGSLPLQFKILARIAFHQSAGLFTNYYHLLLNPGENTDISEPAGIQLLQPPWNDSVDYNTDFIHNGTGSVHVIKFVRGPYSNGFSLSVVSHSTTSRIPVLPAYGFEFPSGTRFNWSVKSIWGYVNVDDYLSEKRLANKNTTEINSPYGFVILR